MHDIHDFLGGHVCVDSWNIKPRASRWLRWFLFHEKSATLAGIIARSAHQRVNRARQLVEQIAHDVSYPAVALSDPIRRIAVQENTER
jgi:hypothetical protein